MAGTTTEFTIGDLVNFIKDGASFTVLDQDISEIADPTKDEINNFACWLITVMGTEKRGMITLFKHKLDNGKFLYNLFKEHAFESYFDDSKLLLKILIGFLNNIIPITADNVNYYFSSVPKEEVGGKMVSTLFGDMTNLIPEVIIGEIHE